MDEFCFKSRRMLFCEILPCVNLAFFLAIPSDLGIGVCNNMASFAAHGRKTQVLVSKGKLFGREILFFVLLEPCDSYKKNSYKKIQCIMVVFEMKVVR